MLCSGTFQLHIEAASPDSKVVAGAVVTAQSFLGAVALGMFPPGRVRAVQSGGVADLVITADDVPESAFAVLNGMLAYHNAVVAPLASWSATLTGRNLCATSEKPPPMPDPPPFATVFDPNVNQVTPPLVIAIDLGLSVDPPRRSELISQLRVWHQLLQGGYPAPDFGVGESGTSQPIIRFDGPSTLRYSVDMWRTGYEAFTPLYHLLEHWSAAGIPIVAVEITS